MTERTFIPFSELREKWFKDPEFVREYEALEEEFALASAVIGARAHAGLTQEELAERMGTSQSAIAKLAAATGTKLRVSFVPDDKVA